MADASWYRLDNVGKFYAAQAGSPNQTIFRLAATMVDGVDAQALQRSLIHICTDGTGTFIVEPSEVLYAETVDGRTFLYGRDRVLESPLRLYELEEALAGTEFGRASKSLIVNFDHVRALRPYLNARLELVLDNGESVIASRQYAPAIKQKIGLYKGFAMRNIVKSAFVRACITFTVAIDVYKRQPPRL